MQSLCSKIGFSKLLSNIQRTNWISWRFAINLPVKVGYSPLTPRVQAFSIDFCIEEAKLIMASKWASLGREGAVEPLTCEVDVLQMGVVSIKKSETCLITYPVVLVV